MTRSLNSRSARSRRTRLGLESLEDRFAPAIINVIGVSDGTGSVTQTAPGVFSATTLRAAITTANSDGNSADTINLSVAGTYQLSQGSLSYTASHDLTISNTSSGLTYVDGGGISRVFDVNPGAQNTTAFTVTFQNLIIQNGVASPGDADIGSGGGIRAQGAASIVLSGDALVNNTATADGGGIALESVGNVSIGTLTISNSFIGNNHAGDAGGGGESDGNGTVTINGSTIQDNTCVNQGAGVWLDAGTANLFMSGDIVKGNVAITMLGGGIGNAGSGSVTLVGCTIENNSSGGTGGGFADAANTGNLTVSNCLFLDNTAAGNGGGIQEGGPNTTISGTVFDGNVSGGNGGGLFVDGGTVTVSNSVFWHDVAVNGGAVEADANSFTAVNCTFDTNHAMGLNGGNGNNAGPGGAGGGIEIQSNGTNTPNDTVANCLFLGNSASNGPNGLGGAINDAAGALTITASQFTGNSAFLHGGAINSTATTLTLSQCTFNGNAAIFGGAVFLQASGTFTNDTFTANQAGNGGGAIEFININVALALLNDTINNNTAGSIGGGLELPVVAPAGLSVQNTTIANNSSFQGPDVFSTASTGITDKGGNLVSSTSGVSGFGAGTLVGVDPRLSKLENNGGPVAGGLNSQQVVQTEALLPGSPAIGKGLALNGMTTDERGFPSPASGRTTPSIGAFEPQFAANASANQAYVDNLYEVLLGRPADPGMAGFVSQLDHNVPPATVALELLGSPEYRSNQVQLLYQRYLNRSADAAGLQAFVNYLGQGGTLEQVAASLINSPEYFLRHGGSAETFITALYESALGRTPDTAGLLAFEQQLARGVPQSQVALEIFSSAEYLADLVQSDFQALFGRSADAPALSFFVNELQHGGTDQLVLAQLLGSAEAYMDRS
jgi:predicted outer membrane repeat protein